MIIILEELLSYVTLLKCGLTTLDEYNEYLNDVFLKQPDSDLLLELQWYSSNLNKTVSTISEYVYGKKIENDKFGKFLFEKMQVSYSTMSIEEFSQKAYSLWGALPNGTQDEEPFLTLCYADDPLSWGDEKQTRKLYEKAFSFYEK